MTSATMCLTKEHSGISPKRCVFRVYAVEIPPNKGARALLPSVSARLLLPARACVNAYAQINCGHNLSLCVRIVHLPRG